MLLLERLMPYGGWIEIFFVSIYGAFIGFKMQSVENAPKWRLISWSVFSVVFFSQLFLGILVNDVFLLTGKLHLPIPAMMISGPIYRTQFSIMTILFLSTILLSGPAWCSQLCYFGAMDGLAARRKQARVQPYMRKILPIKGALLFLIVSVTILLRWLEIQPLIAAVSGLAIGVLGLLLMVFVSGRSGEMFHCVVYCPIATLVNFLKFINPFRIRIDNTCTECMRCSRVCKYQALAVNNIKAGKPGITCTYCGDCLSACRENSIRYKIFKASPETARWIYLLITITLHTTFLALGRI